jgi:hypothetical protein
MSDTMTSILDGSGAPLHRAADLQTMRAALAALYSPATQPVWTEHARPTSQANTAVALLTHADDDGLVPEDYDRSSNASGGISRTGAFASRTRRGWRSSCSPKRRAGRRRGSPRP